MRRIILRNPSIFDRNNAEEELLPQAGILNNFIKQLELITEKVGHDTADTLLKNIFENTEVTKSMQLNVVISELRRFTVDETEIQVVREAFEKRTGHFGKSFCTYYSRDPWKR